MGIPIMIDPFAHIIAPPSLWMDFGSPAQCTTVDLCIYFQQFLDKVLWWQLRSPWEALSSLKSGWGMGRKVEIAEGGEDWDWYVKYQLNMKNEDLEKKICEINWELWLGATVLNLKSIKENLKIPNAYSGFYRIVQPYFYIRRTSCPQEVPTQGLSGSEQYFPVYLLCLPLLLIVFFQTYFLRSIYFSLIFFKHSRLTTFYFYFLCVHVYISD